MMNLVILLGFGAGFLVVFGINLLLADVLELQRQRARTRFEDDLRLRQEERARSSMQKRELYEQAVYEPADSSLSPTLVERFVRMLDESGSTLRPMQAVGVSLGVGLLAFAIVAVLSRGWAMAAVVGLVGGALPMAYVALLRSRRMEKLLSQLPDGFDLMSRMMRAGQTISQSLLAVADESSSPIADEFRYCYDQQNLGLSAEAAMRDLARRTDLLELKIFVLAVMIHRQTGGNLAELLDKLGKVIRARFRIRGVIKTFTAEGRLQAYILMALPPGMLCIMLIVNRPYAMVLFEYPALLIGMVISMALGGLWMRQIINFDQ